MSAQRQCENCWKEFKLWPSIGSDLVDFDHPCWFLYLSLQVHLGRTGRWEIPTFLVLGKLTPKILNVLNRLLLSYFLIYFDETSTTADQQNILLY